MLAKIYATTMDKVKYIYISYVLYSGMLVRGSNLISGYLTQTIQQNLREFIQLHIKGIGSNEKGMGQGIVPIDVQL